MSRWEKKPQPGGEPGVPLDRVQRGMPLVYSGEERRGSIPERPTGTQELHLQYTDTRAFVRQSTSGRRLFTVFCETQAGLRSLSLQPGITSYRTHAHKRY